MLFLAVCTRSRFDSYSNHRGYGMMAWQWLKATELPLGKRILRIADQGNDVRILQEMLKQTGFYFGNSDGVFGVLTEEAVVLFQKTFHLRVDGRVGREVVKALTESTKRVGRLIYTVKNGENLSTISQKFGVRNSAWESIAGQGRPEHRIYPGMKLILNEKAVFLWEPGGVPRDAVSDVAATGMIRADLHFATDLELAFPENWDPQLYHLVEADTDSWSLLLASPKQWRRWCAPLQLRAGLKWGLDLRSAPMDAIFQWVEFVKYLRIHARPIDLAVLPLRMPSGSTVYDQLLWLNLPLLAKNSKWIIWEPVLNQDSPQLFYETAAQTRKAMKSLLQLGLAGRSLWLGEVCAWDWNLDQSTVTKIAYREARMIRAMNHRASQSWSDVGFTRVNYQRRREPHCLIYRDETDWASFLKLVLQYQLFGVVLRNFAQLGQVGEERIAATFAVLPSAKLS
ncbi:putative peptidoglycan binding protein [Hydrogenispora ethanolica]|uniref:Putative peptidoglycan binding protein n=2 Tax=Hydrogenispora ethanolica TaxID=1082276 RepID=A0A4R1RD90_HYDET|nr:putative peptidoglycan binding protein [Hydrogenispora ethanolica]